MAPLHTEDKYLQPDCNAAVLSSHSNIEASHVPEQIIPSNTPGCTLLRTHFLIASHHFTGCPFILTDFNNSRVSADFRHLAAPYLFWIINNQEPHPSALVTLKLFIPRLCWWTLSQFLIHEYASLPVGSFLNNLL